MRQSDGKMIEDIGHGMTWKKRMIKDNVNGCLY